MVEAPTHFGASLCYMPQSVMFRTIMRCIFFTLAKRELGVARQTAIPSSSLDCYGLSDPESRTVSIKSAN